MKHSACDKSEGAHLPGNGAPVSLQEASIGVQLAGATGDKEASVPPPSPLVSTLEEGSAVLADLPGSPVSVEQVGELGLREDLSSSALKTRTEVPPISNQGTPASSLTIAPDVPE